MEASFWLSPPLVIIWLAFLALPVVVLVRALDQAYRDHNRRIYRLSFPAELTSEQVLAFVYAISGTLRPLRFRLLGTPNVVLELLATEHGLTHRLRVPWTHEEYVLSQLRSLVPGIRVTPEKDERLPQWTRIAELGQTNSTRSLRVPKPEQVATSLLASMQGLHADEAVLLQWVISPAIPTKPPRPVAEQRVLQRAGWRSAALAAAVATDRDKIADERAKLEEPNLSAVVRIAAAAHTLPRAKHLVVRVRAALASVRTPHTRFRQSLILPSGRLFGRVREARGPIVFPAHLAASELVALSSWPIGGPHIAGLAQTTSRHLPPSAATPKAGRVVAVSNFPGAERPLAITPEDSCKHLHVVGPTGAGKTTLLANLVAQDMKDATQDMEAGAGVIVIDSKGDKDSLFRQALDYVPRSRVNDVIVLNVQDQAYPVGFNILAQGRPQVVASDLQDIFNSLYGRSGVRVPQQFFHGLMTLMTSRAAVEPLTFVDLVPLFSPMTPEDWAFGDALIRGMPDDFQRNWWQLPENKKREGRDLFFSPIMERIWQLNNRPEIRNIIGQSTSSFDMREVVRQRKILLVNLAGLGKDTASLLGSLVVNALWHAVQSGAADPQHPTFLYLDEFQKFVHLPISLTDMLAQARSFGLAMILAHQELGQLTMPEVRQAAMSNARSKVVFQNDQDARILAAMFGKRVSEDDIKHLGSFEVILRIAHGGNVSEPATATTLSPAPKHGLARLVREQSRKKYGRPVAAVDEEIRTRRSLVATSVLGDGSKSRPKIGLKPWGER